MAALLNSERAPGVSAAMSRRVAAALDAGERPALKNKNLRLGSIVLQRADGRDAPALREVEIQMGSRNLDTAGVFDTFQASTTFRGATLMRWTPRDKSASSLGASAGRIA